MVAKKKSLRPSAQQASGTDDLVQKIKDEITALLGEVCDPDPPGCSGNKKPVGNFVDFWNAVREADYSKEQLVLTIQKDFDKLFPKS